MSVVRLTPKDETSGDAPVASDSAATPASRGAGKLRGLAGRLLDAVDPVRFGRALAEESLALARRPVRTAGAMSRFLSGSLVATGTAVARAMGGSAEGPMAVPSKDRRFNEPTWQQNAYFYRLLQQHLLREQLYRDLLGIAELEGPTAQKARLASQLMVDALAPTNFFLTNPAALRRAFETGGLSVLRGLRTWLDDLRLREGWPRLVDSSRFELGKTLAATPGKVVYRNALFELLQYAPQTPDVHAIPLLCSPPSINKYYIMDLAPGRSFIEWAVKHGHTTFSLSYRNPDASLRDAGVDTYVKDGVLQALRVVQEITSAKTVNVAALCLGGTLATMLTAYLDAAGDRSVHTLTLMNTLIDFSEPGPLGAFTDPPTVAQMLRTVDRRGYLAAHEIARTFNLLRPNDLLFNYVGNGWLMGEEPPAFDLLAWNSDGTRIPARFLREYLDGCYQENRLATDRWVLDGRRLRISAIPQDTFIVGAVEDHITPWRSAYRSTGLLGGKVHFVLTSAGHIAGVVNPPSKSAAYWVGGPTAEGPDAWQSGATRHQDTWWHDWARWIGERAGPRQPPPTMGSEEHPPRGDAPGTYVHVH
jgi:polyhydroxyalkanoate synthase subunit PhaC